MAFDPDHAGQPPADRVQVLGVQVDAVTLEQAVERVNEWLYGAEEGCRYVVTPNLDHAVLLKESAELRQAYRGAGLIIPDGMPMVWGSWLRGGAISERVAGSDLVPALMSRAQAARPLRVFLLGAAPGVADRAAQAVHARFAHVRVVGTNSPEPGFERDLAACSDIVAQINATEAQLLVVGFGAPKQELWVHRHGPELRCRAALCAGATIDFLAGHRRRAPHWMQKTGTEWLYRALSEPKRLLPRYARDACHLPSLLYADWLAARPRSKHGEP